MTADPVTADVAAPHRAPAGADNSSGDLPRGWVWTTLGEVTTFVRNGLPQRPDFAPPGHRILRINAVRPLKVDLNEVRYLDLPESAVVGYFVHDGDLLFTRYNGSLELLGVVGMVRNCTQPTLHPDKLIRVLTALDGQLAPYLELACNFGMSRTYIEGRARTTAGQTGISGGDLKQMPIPLPPLAEQRRIVAAIEQQFTRLDAGVAALRRAQTALKRYRAAVLKAAVEGRLTEDWRRTYPDAERASTLLARILAERRARWEADLRAKGKDPAHTRYPEPAAPDIASLPAPPVGWGWARLGDLIVEGPQNGLYLPQSRYGSGVPILRIDDFQNGHSRSSAELRQVDANCADTERYSLRQGDVVINRVNSLPQIGKCLLVSERNLPAIFESNMMRMRLTPMVDPAYVESWLRSQPGRASLVANAKWAVNQASINQSDVAMTVIPVPPLTEQHAIVAEVERRLSVVAELEAAVATNLARAERLRQAILREAFAGRLVPQDPDDEPASALLARIRRERGGHVAPTTPSIRGDHNATATGQYSLWQPDGD